MGTPYFTRFCTFYRDLLIHPHRLGLIFKLGTASPALKKLVVR